MMTPDLFVKTGKILFGVHWHASFARALNVNERNVRRWEKGERLIPSTIKPEIVALCRKHSLAIKALADHLERS